MVRGAYQMALAFRQRVATDPLLGRWFRVLDVDDLVPAGFRPSGVTSYLPLANPDAADGHPEWDQAWVSDEFVLDPTRVTLYIGKTGMSGFEFREQILMDRFGIQINKTSFNSVLLIFTIGVTWTSLQYLLDALRRTAVALARAVDGASQADHTLLRIQTKALTTTLPPLPHFSGFDPAFRPSEHTPEGDVRAAFYAAYEESDREYVPLTEAVSLTAAGRLLVSATFVVPYPPGFPVLVPGQVVSPEILTFLTRLDIKEIHGYRPELGLCVFTERFLQRYAAEHVRRHSAPPKSAAERDEQTLDPPPDPARSDAGLQDLARRVASGVEPSGGDSPPIG